MASSSVYQKVLALCERRGFIYNLPKTLSGVNQSPGFSYGPLGAELKRNILNEWWYTMVTSTGYVHPVCSPAITRNSSEAKVTSGETADHTSTVDQKSNSSDSFTGVQQLRKSLLTPDVYEEAFKQMESTRLPYGVAEIGKVFRKLPECFHLSECEVAGVKLFCSPKNHQQWFSKWQRKRLQWWKKFAVSPEDFSLQDNRRDTSSEILGDIHYKNLQGIQTLEEFTSPSQSSPASDKQSMSLTTQVDQAVLAYIFDAYTEGIRPYEETSDKNTILRLHLCLAPYKAVVLMEEDDSRLQLYCKKLAEELRIAGVTTAPSPVSGCRVEQLLLQDEIGTPFRIFGNNNTLKTGVVTLQDRDSTIKEEINGKNVLKTLQQMIEGGRIN